MKASGNAIPLRVLQVEDTETDAELVLMRLKRHGYAVTARRVWKEAAFIEALDTFAPEIILSDFSMPNFDGMRALELLRQRGAPIPFVFVSGSIRPDLAASALANGAAAVLIKDDMTRLGEAVDRALGKAPPNPA